MNGLELAAFLEKRGFTVKSKTKTSMVLMVDGNRISKMEEVAKLLKNFGAKIDRNLSGSSIGGIVVNGIKIRIKTAGRSAGLDVEAKALDDLNDAIVCAVILTGGPISVRVKNRSIGNIVQVVKTAGTPKSDFHLADENNKPLIHISHKKGSTPRDFQQWGGVTEDRILNHPEVKQFGINCRALYGNRIPSGESVFAKIKDSDLKMMAVFGVMYDRPVTDVNRVDVLLQGDPGLKYVSDGTYRLTATGSVHYHGDIPDGEFEPVLAMIYKGDRDQLGIKGARASICLLYTSPSPRDATLSRMPSSA